MKSSNNFAVDVVVFVDVMVIEDGYIHASTAVADVDVDVVEVDTTFIDIYIYIYFFFLFQNFKSVV